MSIVAMRDQKGRDEAHDGVISAVASDVTAGMRSQAAGHLGYSSALISATSQLSRHFEIKGPRGLSRLLVSVWQAKS